MVEINIEMVGVTGLLKSVPLAALEVSSGYPGEKMHI